MRHLRYRLRRVQAFFRLPGAFGFGLLLAFFAALSLCAAWMFRFLYQHPETGEGLDWVQAAYAVCSLFSFNPGYPLPDGPVAALYFALPLTSLLVLGKGLSRLGRALLDKEAWTMAMASTHKDHVIVCGLGRVGYRVTRWLLDLGEEVVGIESSASAACLRELEGSKVPILVADAQAAGTLSRAGVERARCLIPCTNNDLLNLNIALEAKRLNPKIRLVLRIFDDRLAENVDRGFDIDASFSVSALAAPAFAAAATRAPVDHAFSFGGENGGKKILLTICKFTVVPGSALVGYTLDRLEREFDVSVLLHRHGKDVDLHPPGERTLAADDGFVVSAELGALDRLAKLTPPTRQLKRPDKARG